MRITLCAYDWQRIRTGNTRILVECLVHYTTRAALKAEINYANVRNFGYGNRIAEICVDGKGEGLTRAHPDRKKNFRELGVLHCKKRVFCALHSQQMEKIVFDSQLLLCQEGVVHKTPPKFIHFSFHLVNCYKYGSYTFSKQQYR